MESDIRGWRRIPLVLTATWTVWNAYGKRLESSHTKLPGSKGFYSNAGSRGARDRTEPFIRRSHEGRSERAEPAPRAEDGAEGGPRALAAAAGPAADRAAGRRPAGRARRASGRRLDPRRPRPRPAARLTASGSGPGSGPGSGRE